MSQPADALPGLAVDDLFRPLLAARGVVLAVSGGPDSTAMMHLAARWHPTGALPQLTVACVDHGLRAGSRAEAEAVRGQAEALGFPATILVWEGPKPTQAIQEKAREARCGLLIAHALVVGATHMATAHTLDDQAETVLFRLARGSGLSGLSGMRPATRRDDITHLRPLLGIRKATLLSLCRREGWSFAEDPSNTDETFARPRLRAIAAGLAREGMTPKRLAQLAERMARADAALEAMAHEAELRSAVLQTGLHRRYATSLLADHPEEVVLRVVGAAVMAVGGEGPIRLERLERLTADLLACWFRREELRRTLHGCIVVLDHDGFLSVTPETARKRGLRSC